MDNIILYLLTVIQEQYKTICWLLNLICRFIPLKQWAFDDSHSPKYQKISTDHLSVIKPSIQQNWQFLLEYYLWKSLCGAPHHYLYDNNGGNGQYQCKVCGQTIVAGDLVSTPVRFVCPYCGHPLVTKLKKTVSFFACTSVSTPSAPSICITFPRLIKSTLRRSSVRIDISSIISTGNSPWISSEWT